MHDSESNQKNKEQKVSKSVRHLDILSKRQIAENLSDDFLFGDSIEIDPKELQNILTNQSRKKTLSRKKVP